MNCEQSLMRLAQHRFRLSKEYSLPNDTYEFHNGAIPCIGHEKHLSMLKKKILHTDGGAFLVTGFRGAGKSTLVNNAIENLRAERTSEVFSVKTVFTIEKTYTDILFELSKGLYLKVKGSDVWKNIDERIKDRMESINSRIQLGSLRVHKGNMSEISGKIASSPALPVIASEVCSKSQFNSSAEGEYRELTAYELETELSEIIAALHSVDSGIKIVFIVDEIDKLTQDQEGRKDFDRFLNRAKSIVSSWHAVFIFIAGIDIYEAWEMDRGRIDSIYSSVFSWQLYLPCVWDSVSKLFHLFAEKDMVFKPVEEQYSSFVQNSTVDRLRQPFEHLRKYFVFAGKGLPRRILQLFDGFVLWENGCPLFVLDSAKISSIVYANSLFEKFQKLTSSVIYKSEIDRDTYFMLILSMLDCLQRIKKKTFTEKDIMEALLLHDSAGEAVLGKIVPTLMSAFLKEHIIIELKNLTQEGESLMEYVVSDQTIALMKHEIPEWEVEEEIDKFSVEKFYSSAIRHEANKVLENTVSVANNRQIRAFWAGQYIFEKAYKTTRGIRVCLVVKKTSKQKRIATFYSREAYEINQGYDRELLRKCGSEAFFRNELLINTEIIFLNGAIFSVAQDVVQGILLNEMATANITNELTFNVVKRLVKFVRYMLEKQCGYIHFTPENIMVLQDGNIKIVNFLKLFRRLPDTMLAEHVPESEIRFIQEKQCIFSMGQLLLFLISQGERQVYTDIGSIDRYEMLRRAKCSAKLTDLICAMTDTEFSKRPSIDELVGNMQRCQEYKDQHAYLVEAPSIGEVVIYKTRSAIEKPTREESEMQILPTTVAVKDSTLFSSEESAYIIEQSDSQDDKERSKLSNDEKKVAQKEKKSPMRCRVLLQNYSTGEIIEIFRFPFVIGRSYADADYVVTDNLVSKKHITVTYEQGVFMIHNHGKNGIILSNGDVLNTQTVINDAIRFRIGHQYMAIMVVNTVENSKLVNRRFKDIINVDVHPI